MFASQLKNAQRLLWKIWFLANLKHTFINVAFRLDAKGDLVSGGGGSGARESDHCGSLGLGIRYANEDGTAAEALSGVVEGLAGVDAGIFREDFGNVENVVVALVARRKVRRCLDLLVIVQPDDVKARFACGDKELDDDDNNLENAYIWQYTLAYKADHRWRSSTAGGW